MQMQVEIKFQSKFNPIRDSSRMNLFTMIQNARMYRHRRIDPLHVRLLHEDLLGFGAQLLHFVLLNQLAVAKLLNLSASMKCALIITDAIIIRSPLACPDR